METIYDAKLFIVEDDQAIADMVRDLLGENGFHQIRRAETIKAARSLFNSYRPEAVLLDLWLPDGNGMNLLKEWRLISAVPIIVITAAADDESRLLGLGLAADDYLTKPFLPRELLLRLQTILTRVYFPDRSGINNVFKLGEAIIDLAAGTIKRQSGTVSLTAKEIGLLTRLHENSGRIVTTDALYESLWGGNLYRYENALMVHVRRLREKIEADPSNPRFLITARGIGYKLNEH